jgi:hypothetical protein
VRAIRKPGAVQIPLVGCRNPGLANLRSDHEGWATEKVSSDNRRPSVPRRTLYGRTAGVLRLTAVSVLMSLLVGMFIVPELLTG